MIKRLILSIIIFICCGCSYYVSDNEETININIKSIGINHTVNISGIHEEVNGVVMFKEYGRPDIEDSNTIIGAHSGYGPNAIFNDINKLEIGDNIELLYEDEIYKYEIEYNYEVDESELGVLNNKNYSILTLLSCKVGDSSKRIVVIARLIPNI